MDLDGTLLRSDGSISDRTMRVLRTCESLGMKLVIATARSMHSLGRFLPQNFPRCSLICCHGAEVCDPVHGMSTDYLSPSLCRQVVSVIEQNFPGTRVSIEIDGRLLANRPLPTQFPHELVDIVSECRQPLPKIMFDMSQIRDVSLARLLLPQDCALVTARIPPLAWVTAASATKASVLALLLKKWDMSWADVIAFGDDLPDLEMLSMSGTGVAMANAVREAKMVADCVAGSNDEDGVAGLLDNLLADPMLTRAAVRSLEQAAIA